MATKPRDYKNEAFQESEARSSTLRWMQSRVDTLRKSVTAHDVLRMNGVTLSHSGDREEQFPCPFHGVDRHPSARVYPESVTGPSHVWCFVCRKNWDAIGLWKQFLGGSGDMKFSRVLFEMERAFSITPPERPPSPEEMEDFEDPEVVRVGMTFDLCEDRLKREKQSFDMKSHLMLGAVLDRVRYQFENGQLAVEKTKEVLQKVLDKIGARVRQ